MTSYWFIRRLENIQFCFLVISCVSHICTEGDRTIAKFHSAKVRC
jgi:hypothetical protein